jgi:hypothetical protein
MSRRPAFGITIALTMIAAGLGAQPKPDFGTAQATYVTFGAMDFSELFSGDGFFKGFLLSATSGSGIFDAVTHLPSGALLTYFEVDYCDTNTGSNHVNVNLYSCPTIGNCPGGNSLSTLTSTANGCASISTDISGLNYTVDNATHRLYLLVGTPSLDTTNQLSGVILGYKLQVSPAPASPTFADVPPSDPGFQYIEALAASGITGGCGGGNYCPDANLTRRQMAVFLAKALGLQWP